MTDEQVLIVSRTHMGESSCVGALSITNGTSYRLFDKDGGYPGRDHYQVGQKWRMTLEKRTSVTPPHVEDICVQTETLSGQEPNLRKAILEIVEPWSGPISATYEGTLTDSGRNYYLGKGGEMPSCSTGFWIANERFKFCQAKYLSDDRHSIAYVGLGEAVPTIDSGELVRLSLAGWWSPNDILKKRCYLQISGSFG